MIVFAIVIIIYYGGVKINEITTKTSKLIVESDKVRSEQLDFIGAKLNKNLMDNHLFVKDRFIELATIINGARDRITVLEEKIK